MLSDGARPRHSADDLVAAAQARGHEVKKRLLADWVSIGLLAKGDDRGRGRGKGKDYLWSDNQLGLFLTLLDKHRTVARPVLLNLPVSLWLIWGDAYVPLAQVQRAMASWAGADHRTGAGKSLRTARQLVAELDHPRASRAARRELRELVEEAASGQAIATEDLLEAARAVYDPRGVRPSAAPTAMTPETYVRVLEARLVAVRRLIGQGEEEEPIADDAFLSARQMYLATGPTARTAAAPLDREAQVLAPELLGMQEMVNSACLHLLTLLGLALTTPGGLPVHPPPGPGIAKVGPTA